VEGAGKSTQIALLRAYLEQADRAVCVTREPGGDAVAETVRRLLLECSMTPRAELLLFLAARAQNVESVVRPHLAAGGIVLCDRFIDSSIAYQGCARGLGRDSVFRLNAFAIDGVMPDITFLIDIDPAIGLERQRDRNRMEAESLEFHRAVRQGFLSEARNSPERFMVLDGARDAAAVQSDIRARVEAMLTSRASD